VSERSLAREAKDVRDVAVALPLREIVDADPDRGVALFDATLRQVYANPVAKRSLAEADNTVLTALRDALSGFRDRLARSDGALPPDVSLSVGNGHPLHATISPVRWLGGRWIVLRVAPPASGTAPSIRRLQERFHLTLREAQVAMGVSKGLSNAEAAQHIGVTEKTVKNVLMEVFTKAGVRNRVELALRAHEAEIGLGQGKPAAL
jgi:DNA-binding CsgD family transcriptional regulator